MRSVCAIVIFWFCFGVNEQATVDYLDKINSWKSNEDHSSLSNIVSDADVQIPGFNSSKISSGPIILADKRTLFISNLQFNGPPTQLKYWVGFDNPLSSKYWVAEENFLINHTNVHITLPVNLTLDSINFVAVGVQDTLLDYVFLGNVNRNAIRKYQAENTKPKYIFPKCCPFEQYIVQEQGCMNTTRSFSWNVTIFESNLTGLDPDIRLSESQYELIPYYYKIQCYDGLMIEVSEDDLHGLIYNSSLIIQGEGIKSQNEFCLDTTFNSDRQSYETVSIICYHQKMIEDNYNPNLYLPVLVLSAISFALAAGMYGLILKEQDINKKCFIVFSSSMFVTFLSLIILNVQDNISTCNVFGFVFLTSTVFSFVWISIFCIELFYLVRFPFENKRIYQRWYWYIGISSGISLLIFIISIFSGQLWVPDVPDTFIKNYDTMKCQFSTDFSRSFILFIPMILSILISIISLCFSKRCINRNEEIAEIKNTHDWIENRNSYKFMFRTYIVVIVAALFWLVPLVYYTMPLESRTTQLASDVLEAILGLVILVVFVLNKYTRREIKEKLCRKKRVITEESLGLNGLPTPETPALLLSSDPFLPRNNIETSNNNR